eukprot:COSAG02_NODE_32483_length_515_cov_1.151442_1_plen_45_part_10
MCHPSAIILGTNHDTGHKGLMPGVTPRIDTRICPRWCGCYDANAV